MRTPRSGERRSSMPIVSAIQLACLLGLLGFAHAADFDVDDSADAHDAKPGDGSCAVSHPRASPTCTLRAAIEEANALPGNDQIHLPAGHYILTYGQLLVSTTVAISGEGNPVVDGGGASRVFKIDGGISAVTVSLRDLTITGGYEPDYQPAGGVWVGPKGRLHLVRSVVADNRADLYGSGIYNEGYVRLYRSSLRHNENLSTFDGAGATANGGGAANAYSATMIIEQSAIVRNRAIRGGGIANWGLVSISDSTISEIGRAHV